MVAPGARLLSKSSWWSSTHSTPCLLVLALFLYSYHDGPIINVSFILLVSKLAKTVIHFMGGKWTVFFIYFFILTAAQWVLLFECFQTTFREVGNLAQVPSLQGVALAGSKTKQSGFEVQSLTVGSYQAHLTLGKSLPKLPLPNKSPAFSSLKMGVILIRNPLASWRGEMRQSIQSIQHNIWPLVRTQY